MSDIGWMVPTWLQAGGILNPTTGSAPTTPSRGDSDKFEDGGGFRNPHVDPLDPTSLLRNLVDMYRSAEAVGQKVGSGYFKDALYLAERYLHDLDQVERVKEIIRREQADNEGAVT